MTDSGLPVELVEFLRREDFILEHEVINQGSCLSNSHASFDLVLLDFASLRIEELAICRDIRANYHGPLVVISEKNSEMLHITALAYGADDFVSKPLNQPLFIARISSLLRRVERLKNKNYASVCVGELMVDATRREALFQGKPLRLTTIEFDVLHYLVNNAGRVVSRRDICLALYNSDHNQYSRSIDIYISRIRKKLYDNPVTPRYLKTVRGEGYLFVI